MDAAWSVMLKWHSRLGALFLGQAFRILWNS